jgi:XRE family aerobic/anaerobic benzoate catabolism transcriptional regulator
MSTESEVLSARLAQRVRGLRQERGLTVRALSTRSGLSPRLLALIEAGSANPTLSTLAELASALGTDVPQLLVGDTAVVVALVGLRGAGKSTVGAALGARFGWPFIELDRRIELDSGLSLQALFELHGEEHVRHVEGRVLAEVINGGPVVVACGGGIVTSRSTWSLLRERAFSVWLKATPQDHWDRVRAQGDERPMARRASARAELEALWSARAPYYEQAAVCVDTTGLGADDVVSAVADAVAARFNVVAAAVGG